MSDFHGLPCWYELATNDLPGRQAFYRAVLGWQTTDSQMPGMTYLLSRADGAMVAGMMQAVASQPASWQIHYAVDKCDTMVDQAKALGAQVFVPPSDIPDIGRFAVMADPQGAAFALVGAA